jgi:hypothetical protein
VADGSGLLDLKTLHPMHSDAASGRISVRPKASVSKRCAEFNGMGRRGAGIGGVVNENIWSKCG